MSNRQIARLIRAFQVMRQEYIDILVKTPGHSEAPKAIMSINAKIELLVSFWNWSDESVEFPR